MDGENIETNVGVEIQSDVLETLLQGEQMAIHSYKKAIENVKDLNLKNQFRSFQQAHKRWLEQLSKLQTQHQSNDLSLWSQTVVTGSFTWDRFVSDKVDRDSVRRIRDGEELGIKELKKAKHHISNQSGQAIVDEMIEQANSRVGLLNQEVDRLRLQ